MVQGKFYLWERHLPLVMRVSIVRNPPSNPSVLPIPLRGQRRSVHFAAQEKASSPPVSQAGYSHAPSLTYAVSLSEDDQEQTYQALTRLLPTLTDNLTHNNDNEWSFQFTSDRTGDVAFHIQYQAEGQNLLFEFPQNPHYNGRLIMPFRHTDKGLKPTSLWGLNDTALVWKHILERIKKEPDFKHLAKQIDASVPTSITDKVLTKLSFWRFCNTQVRLVKGTSEAFRRSVLDKLETLYRPEERNAFEKRGWSITLAPTVVSVYPDLAGVAITGRKSKAGTVMVDTLYNYLVGLAQFVDKTLVVAEQFQPPSLKPTDETSLILSPIPVFTLVHEWGHMEDYEHNWPSQKEGFGDALQADLDALNEEQKTQAVLALGIEHQDNLTSAEAKRELFAHLRGFQRLGVQEDRAILNQFAHTKTYLNLWNSIT